MDRIRTLVQVVFSILSNGYFKGYIEGNIFTGASKNACLPGLNCYSCPGALGSCPIGALQAVENDRKYSFPAYAAGFLIAIGLLMGRYVCGWLCPFGLVQDLLHKIPFVKKINKVAGDRILRYLKYLILLLFVIILPMFVMNAFGQGDPWFCKYICPSGTLGAGWVLVGINKGLRASLGFLFVWKSVILIAIIFISIIIYRPFCRYICPLGAIYGLFNRFAIYGFKIDDSKCVKCNACERACKMNITTYKTPNSAECIRCGDCVRACPHGAIKKKLSIASSERIFSKRSILEKGE